jgi:cell wall-associated NlpC family hydrolase
VSPWPVPPTWRPLADAEAQARLERVLRSWEGTPYQEGQQTRGRSGGVDCAAFVVCVLNELTGSRVPVRRVAPDAAVHAPGVAAAALERLVSCFDLVPIEPTLELEAGPGLVLEPGDVVATGPRTGGPGHGLIVGTSRRMCWDATGSGRGVRQISLGLLALVDQVVFGAWRMRDRSWPCTTR